MKTQITLSVEEAEQRLASKMLDDFPYSDNEVTVKIVPIEVQYDNFPLNRTSKLALIKMVRTLAEDLINNRVKISTCGPESQLCGEKYFGLADAKEYVEKYLAVNSPKV